MVIGKTWEIILQVVPLFGAALSLAASTYLLLLLFKLPQPSRQRLLLRQLLYLSVANVLYSVSQVLEESLELAVLSGWKGSALKKDVWRHVCIAIATPGMFSAVASMLCECHLAFAFTASILRYNQTLEYLSWLLYFIWPLALFLAAGDVVSVSGKHGYFWDSTLVGCVMQNGNIVDVWFMAVTVIFCIGCYLVGSCGVCMAGIAVQRRVWRRAQSYPLMAVITLVPTLVYNVVPIDWLYYNQDVNFLCYIGSTLTRNLSGVVYFAFYSLNTRYVRYVFRDVSLATADEFPREQVREHSFGVNFRNEASVVEFQASGLGTPSNVGSSPNVLVESENKNLLISYYMNSWSHLNRGAGRRWGAADEQPDRLLVESPMSSTLRSD